MVFVFRKFHHFNGCFSGSLNGWDRYHIIPQLAEKNHLYTTYILPIDGSLCFFLPGPL